MLHRRSALLLVTLLAVAGPARAQCLFGNEQVLRAAEPEPQDFFGRSVALDEDVLVIGGDEYRIAGDEPGNAWVFERRGDSWIEVQELVPSDPFAGDEFGIAVDKSGDWLAVGAMLDENLPSWQGKVYLFRYDGTRWVETQKIVASNGGQNDFFGRSLCLDGTRLLVGAVGDQQKKGSAYIFEYDGTSWVETKRIKASDRADGDEFARPVALSGDVAVVGAPRDDDDGDNSGSAYVFRFNGTRWLEEQKLTPFDGAAGDEYGWFVAVDGDRTVIGSRGNGGTGAAYVYTFIGGSWALEQKLTASDAAPGAFYGAGVAIQGDLCLVGAHRDDGAALDAGAAYLYRLDGGSWVEVQKLTARAAAEGDDLGWSVTIDGPHLAAGIAARDNFTGAVSVWTNVALDLALSAVEVNAGDPLTFDTLGGEPAGPVALVLVEVNGSPLFAPLEFANFDAEGAWSTSGVVPPGLAGLTLGLQSVGLSCAGSASSPTQTLTIQ